MHKPLFISVLIGILASGGAATASPNTTQLIDKNWNICSGAVQAAERAAAIPRHLLTAISQAESGRWNGEKQANIAWPWTVTAHGKGQFFASKEEAMAETEILLTQGVHNIDVGCMQINLKYHADAFETLSKAFDPTANAAYGANYLRAMHKQTKDWRKAAAHYHSTTPAQAERYKTKVMRLWAQAGDEQLAPASEPKATVAGTQVSDGGYGADIDHALIGRLNAAFKKRRKATQKDEKADRTLRRASRHREQLDAWRQQKIKGLSLAHLANMRRAELELRRSKQLTRDSPAERASAFAKRRQRELAEWRAQRKDPHYSAYFN